MVHVQLRANFQLFCGYTPVQNTGLSTFLATVVSGREHPQRHADFVGRVHPDGTRTSHTLPLPPFASPARALVANKHQHS